MRKKLFFLVLSSLLIGWLLESGAQAVDPSLKGWWKFDETSGRIAADSSSNGNNASLEGGGDPLWVAGQIDGALELDGDDDYVELPIGSVIDSLTSGTFAIWVNFLGFSVQEDWQRIFDFGSGRSSYVFLSPSVSAGGPMRVAIRTTAVGNEDTASTLNHLASGWHHVAVTINDAAQTLTLYLDGEPVATNSSLNNKLGDLGNTTNNWLGRSQYGDDPYFEGVLDDLYIYNRVLSQNELMTLMNGGGLETSIASNPYPSDGQSEVPRDLFLSWQPGNFADTHNVYFGTNFDEVSNADTGSPLLVGPGRSATIFDPGRLDFGQIYFWRIDEVNAPPDSTVFKGDVWSFTVEPLANQISADRIIATASSQAPGQEPENTVNESGLVDDLHSTQTQDMWATAEGQALPAWIQYEFDKPYQLHEMLVWNYNGTSFLAAVGLQDVTVEYSTDGVDWILNDSVSVFNKATGKDDYAANNIVPFGDVPVKFVKITAATNWSGNFLEQYGLSEVRFMYIPVSAREPDPDDGASGADIGVTLGWRAGREADEHKLYINADEQAVIGGTVSPVTVAETSYGPLSLDLGTTYYWRVDEVNNANAIPIWEGDVWSFTTSEYLVVDDFESYNDIPQGEEGSNLVYLTWIDGYDNPSTNGSTMGYTSGASLETEIVRSGHAAPLIYNNTIAGISKITANTNELPGGPDWTVGSPKQLILWVYGNADNNPSTEQMYVEIDGVKRIFSGDIAAEEWQDFPIDLTSLGINLNNVGTVTIGLEKTGATGGSGMIFIDDIRLYALLNK